MLVVLKCPHRTKSGKKCNNTLGIIREGMLTIKKHGRIVADIPLDGDITIKCERCKKKSKLSEITEGRTNESQDL